MDDSALKNRRRRIMVRANRDRVGRYVQPTVATALPTFVSAGAASSGTGALMPGLPAGISTGDILLLAVNNTFTVTTDATLTDAQSFTAVSGGGINSGVFGGGRAHVTMFWRRYDGTGTGPTVADNGEYNVARIYAFRGCAAAGDPWDEVLADGDNDGDATMTLAQSGTTLGTNRLVVSFVGGFTQASSEVLSGWACAALANITQRDSTSYALAEDVFLGCVSGEKAAAGAYGDLTASWTGAGVYWLSAGVSLALKPA